jgi:hypothetical protein
MDLRRRPRMSRTLPSATVTTSTALPLDGPRKLRETLIDIRAVGLPADVSHALADAFWHHFGVRPHRTIMTHWTHLKVFAQGFSLFLAVVAYRGSRETGGGAAQGDLGFFMILIPATVAVVCVTSLAFWVERRSATRAKPQVPASLLVFWLSAVSWGVMAWDWFFLWFIWRA